MNYTKFKEDMLAKLITTNKTENSFTCPSCNLDIDNPAMSPQLKDIRKTISLICDILEEYDKQNH